MRTEVELNFQLAADFLSFLRVRFDAEDGDLNLLCLQGVHPKPGAPNVLVSNPDTPGTYNDAIALIYREPESDGTRHPGDVRALLGTVDPGTYYSRTAPHPQGAAHLTFGQHLYVRGLHDGKPALRALDEQNRVWRDKNGNFKPDDGECVYLGTFGVNIHAGGSTAYINRWSAGCINICGGYEGAPYAEFLERVETHFRRRGSVGVTIWRGSDLLRFADQGWNMRPVLSLGIYNPWVGEAQRLLKAQGFLTGTIDSDFREKTRKAVLAFQAAQELEMDGVIGPHTWAKLAS